MHVYNYHRPDGPAYAVLCLTMQLKARHARQQGANPAGGANPVTFAFCRLITSCAGMPSVVHYAEASIMCFSVVPAQGTCHQANSTLCASGAAGGPRVAAMVTTAAAEPATPPGSKRVAGRDGCGEADGEWSPKQPASERAQRRKRRAENAERAQGRGAHQAQTLPEQVGPALSECSHPYSVRFCGSRAVLKTAGCTCCQAEGAKFTTYSLLPL